MEELSTLVTMAQAGNRTAYETLIGHFQELAQATAYRYLGDHHLAQDAVQEALVEAFLHLPQLQEPRAFPGWFRQIVFRQCTRILRRATVESVPLESAALPCLMQSCLISATVEQLAVKRELQSDVRQAIQGLPLHERQVTTLFYLASYSQQEMSALLGLPITTIKKRLYSARQRLKKRLHTVAHEEIAGAITAGSTQKNAGAGPAIIIPALLQQVYHYLLSLQKRKIYLKRMCIV